LKAQRTRDSGAHGSPPAPAKGAEQLLPPAAGEGWDGGMRKDRARELRKNPTDAERALWKHLRLRQIGGHKFRRQQVIGKYIADFVCFEKRLIVGVDGGQHSQEPSYDVERDKWLPEQGFCVLRFWNNQVFQETEAVREAIRQALTNSPPPVSSPARGEEWLFFPSTQGEERKVWVTQRMT
jgi:very-short-patch-repair endonuclease